jgi:hypothetical protein
MPLVCDHFGKKIAKYCVVKYTIEYLEKYLEEYLGKGIYEMINTHIRKNEDFMVRAICFTILVDFSGETVYNLVSRYKMSFTAGKAALDCLKKSNHDYQFIRKELAEELPETIIEHQNGHEK